MNPYRTLLSLLVVCTISCSQSDSEDENRFEGPMFDEMRKMYEEMDRQDSKKEQDPQNKDKFNPHTLFSPLPAITEIPTISVKEAEGKIEDSELVLGVVVGKEARAYPINMLTGPTREILNDNLGGKAIAATW